MAWKEGRIGQLLIYCAILVTFILVVLCLVFLNSSSARAQAFERHPQEKVSIPTALDERSSSEQPWYSGEQGHLLSLAEEWKVMEQPDKAHPEPPDATSLLNEQVLEPPPEINRKSPLEAGLLGGLLGYGTGQYYSKRKTSGTAFLIADVLCTCLVASGVALAATEPDSFEDLFDHLAGSYYLIGTGGIGLIGSHVIQAIWGPIAADRYNEDLPKPLPRR